jgi:hypothetical protein
MATPPVKHVHEPLSALIAKHAIDIRIAKGDRTKIPPGFPRGTRAFEVRLSRTDAKGVRRHFLTPFHSGPKAEFDGLSGERQAHIVLDACLGDALSVDGGVQFDAWASEFGDVPSEREARRTYAACVRTASRLRAFLSDVWPSFKTCDTSE